MVFDPSQYVGTHEHVPDDQPGGKFGYKIGHVRGDYEIPDVSADECSKHVKVATIGAGISGICLSCLFQKHGENMEHVVYEKNGDIGGTWLEVRIILELSLPSESDFPNRIDIPGQPVPSHAYTFAFALYSDWPQYLSPSEDIFRYLRRVVECFGLRKYMSFNSVVRNCTWDDEEGKWHIQIQDSLTQEIRKDTCDILIGANGILNSWKLPDGVEGLESFKGRLVHTARWPDEFNKPQWQGQHVAVVGSGATSIQVVPTMQPHVKQLDVFVRTPVWFAEFADHDGDNLQYSHEEKSMLKGNARALVQKAKFLEDKLNTAPGFKAFMVNSAEAIMIRKHFTDRMRRYITKDEVFEKLLPNFAVGCRRLTPGNPYMWAVQRENVKIHRCAVTKVTPHSVIGSNGDEVKVDTIVFATGFDTSFIPRHTIIGRNGTSLQEKWSSIPEGYMSVAVPDMPNYFTVMGPSFPIANGSVMGALQAATKYILQMVQKIQREHIHSLSPKESVTDAFNEHTQAWMAGAAWQDPKCRSWYKDNRTGRVNAIWPGSSLHFCEVMKYPRFEDYEIRYESSANMWEFMGLGFTKDMLSDEPDLSPYISTEEVDDRFMRFEPDLAAEDDSVRKRAKMVHDMPENF